MLIERFPSRGRDRVIRAGTMPSYLSPGRYRVTAIIDEESGRIRALDLEPEGVHPETIEMEAGELRLLRWIRFDPSSREKLPPIYRAFPSAGIALVYDGPAYGSYEKQRKTAVPWIRPSTWSEMELGRSREDSDAFETIFFPVLEFIRFAREVHGLDFEKVNATYMHARLYFRETAAFSAFRRVEFIPHLFFYDYARRVIEARGLSPDDVDAWNEVMPELPVPAHTFLPERFRVSGKGRLKARNAAVFFPMSLTPWHGNTDAIGMVRTDDDGTIREFFVASLLQDTTPEEAIKFIARLPGNEDKKPVFLDDIFPLVPDAESGEYAFPIEAETMAG